MTDTSSLSSVHQRLGELRARIRRFFLVDGLGKLALALVGLVFVDFWIDRLFRMDHSQRLVMLVIMGGVALYLVWRFLFRPLRARITDEALLHEIEARNPELNEGLLSAYELSRSAPEQASPALVREAIERGLADSENIAFDGVLDGRRHRRNLGLLGLGALLLAGIGVSVFASESMGIWANRNLLLGDATWPQDYYLNVVGAEDGKLVVPRGEDWPVIVDVRKVLASPDSLQLETDVGGSARREVMERSDTLRFESLLRDVQEEYRFRVVGRRASTPWIRIELVERPEVIGIELEATPPAYTGLPPAPLPAGSGPYYVLKGNSLLVQGQASKPLVGAELARGEARFKLSVHDGDRFTGGLAANELEPGVYTVSLLGREQVTRPGATAPEPLRSSDTAQFTIRAKEDKTPKVKAQTEGIGGLVVAGARIPYKFAADDDFAITAFGLDVVWQVEESEAGAATNGSHNAVPEDLELGRAEVSGRDSMEMSRVAAPEGARVTLTWKATDNDDVSGPKVGESQPIHLRVVREAELREDIVRREKEIRQRFETARKKQIEIGVDIEALQVDTAEIDAMASHQRLQLNRAQKAQKLLASQVGQQADRLEQIHAELLNNRLEAEDSSLIIRLRSEIIEPMRLLADRDIPGAADRLDGLRRLGDRSKRQAGFEQSLAAQKTIVETMDKILKHMVKNEDFQLAVNLLHEIKKAQEGVRRMTEEEKARRIKALIEEQNRKNPRSNDGK